MPSSHDKRQDARIDQLGYAVESLKRAADRINRRLLALEASQDAEPQLTKAKPPTRSRKAKAA
jgi:hypothetical protein